MSTPHQTIISPLSVPYQSYMPKTPCYAPDQTQERFLYLFRGQIVIWTPDLDSLSKIFSGLVENPSLASFPRRIILSPRRRDSMKDTAELFASLDALKVRLDAHCPLSPDVVSQIREDMRIRFTYHSNAIEGTRSQ